MRTATIILIIILATIIGRADDAHVASRNLSKAADMSQLDRRIVFYNGITSEYILTIEGRCSVATQGSGRQLTVTCKTADDSYKKHYLGLSDNVTYFSEQRGAAKVDAYRYKVIFKPSVIVPDIDLSLPKPKPKTTPTPKPKPKPKPKPTSLPTIT